MLVYVFIIAKYVIDHLHAYIYDEVQGTKCGNKVVYKMGIIKDWEDPGKLPGESCTFVLDNCASQNNKKMMLRFPMWMIEISMFENPIDIPHLGHTKNGVARIVKIELKTSEVLIEQQEKKEKSLC